MDMKFTQDNGFEDCDLDKELKLESKDNESFEAWLARAQFSLHEAMVDGPEDSWLSFNVYERQPSTLRPSQYKYLVALEDVLNRRYILVPDDSSLMMLRIELAPLITMANLTAEMLQIRRLVERTFRAWHGHDKDVVCNECDPNEVRRRRDDAVAAQEWQEQRERERAEREEPHDEAAQEPESAESEQPSSEANDTSEDDDKEPVSGTSASKEMN